MGPFYYYQDADANSRSHNNWYADGSNLTLLSYPWFGRGGEFTDVVLAGQFYFSRHTGDAGNFVGLRLVLTK